MTKKRVVVTGVGIVSPLGRTRDLTWSQAKAGQSGIGPISQFATDGFDVRIAGECRDFVVSDFVSAKEIKKMDRFIHLALGATAEAWSQAGLTESFSQLDPHRVAVYYGVGMGGIGSIQNQYDVLKGKGPSRLTPFFIPQVITNMAPGHISMQYGIKGRNFAYSSACASGAHAIGEAALSIELGHHDMVVAGGSESVVCELAVAGFSCMRALSTRNEDPAKASRPWDQGRDGFVLAEGAATLILESEESARARGVSPLGYLTGYGASSDAHHITSPSPDGEGAIHAMTMAIKSAGKKPEDVRVINAHGTSTGAGDVAELKAIAGVFSKTQITGGSLKVSSTKSMTGHTLGAAGALEAALSVLSLQHQVVLPTINLEDPDPVALELGVDLVPNRFQEFEFDHILSNSFGFGGTNCSLLFERAQLS